MKLKHHILHIIAPLCLLTCSAQAEDYKKSVYDIAHLFYPTHGPIRDQYIQTENTNGKIFTDYHSNSEFTSATIDTLKKFCIKKHPYSQQRRAEEMRTQLAYYKFYKKGLWAEGLTSEGKEKILTIAALLSGEDYEMRYRWALAEAEAFKKLSRFTTNTALAQKKWPNSYQSQLLEVLGIRPGTPLPYKQPKQGVILQSVQN